jgi:hypothetical protein
MILLAVVATSPDTNRLDRTYRKVKTPGGTVEHNAKTYPGKLQSNRAPDCKK